MSEDQSQNQNEAPAPAPSRTPLVDVTNHLIRKRPFSSLSSSPSNSVANCPQSGEFWNKVALVVEHLENKKVNVGQCVRVSDDEELKNKKVKVGPTGFSPLKGGKVSALDRIHLSENELTETPVVDGGGEDKFGSSSLVDGGEDKFGSSSLVDGGEDKFGSGGLVDSHHSFSLERCSGFNHAGCSNLSTDVASLNSCSCTFCNQVAYIWSDLHYKDVKERVSVSVKSQKDSSDLAQRYIFQTEMSRLSHKTPGNVEPDLTTQWKSLFLHLENVFGTETSLLQADLQCLRSIRDDFKTNLEMINAMPVDVHPCSSNSSDHVMI